MTNITAAESLMDDIKFQPGLLPFYLSGMVAV